VAIPSRRDNYYNAVSKLMFTSKHKTRGCNHGIADRSSVSSAIMGCLWIVAEKFTLRSDRI